MDVAIVGAGAAGAGAAYALDAAGVAATVFERRNEVAGRAATRRARGCVYDYGANYIKAEDPRVNDLIREVSDGLIDVEAPVWTFDRGGAISEGRDGDEHKWSYRDGIAELPGRLFARTDASIRLETPIETVERAGDRWRLAGETGGDLGAYDALVLTPAAPQTAALLDGATWDDGPRRDLVAAVDAVPYRTIVSVVLRYPFELDRPYYALVNTDRDHEIGWVSREECKPGHVPDGSLLIVQMAPDWSAERCEDPAREVIADAIALTAGLLDDARLYEPAWTDYHCFRHALPDRGVDREAIDRAEAHDLYVAGDWVAGDGRVHLALKSGLEAGERITDR